MEQKFNQQQNNQQKSESTNQDNTKSNNEINKNQNKPIFLPKHENSLDFKKNKTNLDEMQNFHENFSGIRHEPYYNPSTERLNKAIIKLQTSDDMEIITELISLCDFLSLSSDKIGFDLKMPILLEEIFKNLEKTYLPELIIYCLQCINYILDINPSLNYVIRRIKGVPKLLNTISSVEDITCIDYIIKIFDKIAVENSRLLLENNVFLSLMNILGFFNIEQKKSVMKICSCICNHRIYLDEFNQYIKPGLNELTNLTKIDFNSKDISSGDIFILEKCIIIYYNIINCLKNENSKQFDENFDNEILKVNDEKSSNNIIENFVNILYSYFISDNKLIPENLIKMILKIIVTIFEKSQIGMQILLNNKLLEIISEIINQEFYDNNNNNSIVNNDNNIIITNSNNINNNNYNYNNINKKNIYLLPDLFNILIYLFPSSSYKINKKNNENINDDKKLLKPENKHFYDYFCKNILLPLIKNITNKFTHQISNNFIKIILAFTNTANKSDIEIFLPSKPISQIIIKLLNENSISTLTDCFSLLECLLEKAPELFITNLIREGIVDTLRNYNLNEKIKIYKKKRPINDRFFSKYYRHFKKMKLLKLKKKKEEKMKEKEKLKEKEIELLKEKEITKEKEISKEKEKIINKDSESIINEEDFFGFHNDELSIDTNKTKEKKNISSSLENTVEIKKEKIKNYDLSDKEIKEDPFINEEEDEEEEDEEENINIKEKSFEEDEENNNDLDEDNIEDNDNFNEDKINNNNDLYKMELENSFDKLYDFPPLPKDKLENSQTLSQKKDDKVEEKLQIKATQESEPLFKNNKIDVKIIKNEKEKNSIKDDNLIYDKNKLKEQKYINIPSINPNTDKNYSETYDDLFFGSFIKHRIKKKKTEINFEKEEIKLLEDKKNEILSKYLTEEKINEYLSKINLHGQSNLINIKNTLISLQEKLNLILLNNNNNISTDSNGAEKENCLFNIINILTDENNYITLFELENSKVLSAICHFLCPVFYEIYSKIDDNKINSKSKIENIIKTLEKNKKLIDEIKKNNTSIFDNLQNFYKLFKNDQKTLKNFIKLINSTINSITLPYFSSDESEKKNLLPYFEKYYNADLSNKIRVIYNENIYKERILNNKDIKLDDDYKQKLEEFNSSFKITNKITFICTEYSTFKNVTSSLLTNSNIPFLSNEKYQIEIIYFINIEDNKYNIDLNNADNNNKEQEKKSERFYIEENWNYKEMKTNLFNKYKRTFNYLTIINFGLSVKCKDEKNIIPKDKKITNEEEIITKGEDGEIIDILNDYSQYINQNFLYTDYVNIDKLSFIKEYNENILYAKGIYFSKCLSPSLFLLNVLYLSINKYHEIFSLPNNWFSSKILRDEWKNLFINQKIDLFILKSSQDPYKITKTQYPNLCKIIVSHNSHLTKFETRLLSFKTSYSPGRSLINLQNYFKHTDPTFNNKNNIIIKKNMRIKIIVERDKILEHGFNIIHNEMTSKFSGYLEFEYKNEIGNGLGPTLEFYTLIIENIKQNNNLWYNTGNGTLYPKIFDFSKKDDNLFYILNLFELLGYIIGRAIYDDRLLDIPLNEVFWCLLLKKPVLFKDIENIDSYLYNSLKDFIELIKKKQKLLKENNKNINLNEVILYKGTKLSDLDIYFIFPGYDIELKNNGRNILLTMDNIEEYVNLIYNFLLYKGISKIKQAFIKGFNTINKLNNLECFSPNEIEEFICGSNESKWEYEDLLKYLKPEHGYTNKSKVFLDLIKFMSNLNKEQRKKFLKFSTGCPRLPMGGFKNLSPKLTVVKKTFGFGENPDCFLPTVMTCQNYFKLPEYSSYNILESKILLAMEEGGNEFNLS